MKKLLFIFSLMLLGLVSKAQVGSNDLIIQGYVTNATSGLAIPNWPVIITGMGLTQTVETNSSGWYSDTISNGSETGPNQLFFVQTMNCDSTYMVDSVSNNQGTIDTAFVDFQLCVQYPNSCMAMFNVFNDPTVSGHIIFENLSTSSDTIASYVWSVNGVTISTLPYFENIFPLGQFSEVCLTITSSTGCVDTYCQLVSPGNNGTCLPDFTSQASTSNSLSYTFTNTSFTSAPNPTYYWYFGDGNNSTEANPTHVYSQAGTYSVCLVVNTIDCQNTICHYLTVVEGAGPCNAQFSYTVSGINPSQVFFINESTGAALSSFWSIGGSIFSAETFPTYTFPSAGEYEVCLNVVSGTMDPIGCEDTFCQFVTILEDTSGTVCNAGFQSSFIGNIPTQSIYQYQFYSAYPSNDNSVSHEWLLSNGEVSTLANPIFGFVPDVYTICHYVYAMDGTCADSTCTDLVVVPDTLNGCNAMFSAYISNTVTNEVTFTNLSTDLNASFIWQFADGSPSEYGVNATHIYSAPGSYPVNLNMTGNGCNDDYTFFVTILPDTSIAGCSASFNYTCQVANPQDVLFDASMSVIAGNNPGFTWDFGDGSSGMESTMFHTYANPGFYLVCLTVYSDSCTNTYCGNIYAGIGDSVTVCNAGFQSSYIGDVPNPSVYPYQFYTAYSSNDNSVSHEWLLSNGETTTEANPIFGFAPGVYTICHFVYAMDGTCADSTCIDFVVVPDTLNGCDAMFNSEISASVTGQVNFYNVSSDLNASFIWDFGDGNTANTINAQHVYSQYGTYSVTLTMVGNGCFDTYTGNIIIDTTNYLYDIGGMVYVGANIADSGWAKLYSIDPISLAAELISTVQTDTGFYLFQNLPIGTYLVKAGLNETSAYYSQYTPTYFGEQYYWYNAQQIVNDINNYDYNISLIYGANPGGNGFVGGSIDDGPFRLYNPEYSSAQSPVMGAQVIITDLADVPQRWIESDASGNFQMSDLAYGTYRLMADQPGMTCLPIEFTLSEETPGVNIDLVMGDDITGIQEPITAIVQGEVFPNPAQTSASIRIQLPVAGKLAYTLTTLTGQVVVNGAETAASGKQTLNIPVSGLAQGLYVLNLFGDNGQLLGVRKLNVAH